MKFPSDTLLQLTITHGGLSGRELKAAGNRLMFQSYKYRSVDTDFPTSSKFPLGQINEDIVSVVKIYTKPFFEMFNGFELDDKVLRDIVLNYVQGKVT